MIAIRRTTFFVLLLVANTSLAQSRYVQSQGPSLNYSIVRQDAPKPWVVLNTDLFHMDLGVDNISGGSFNIGIRGFIYPVEKVGVDYTFRTSWLTFGLYGSNTDIEFGGHYLFLDRPRKRKTKILLDYDIQKEYDGPKTTEIISSRSILVEAEKRTLDGLRFGLITKRGPYDITDLEEVISAQTTLSSTGIYLGVFRKVLTNVFADIEGWGRQFNSAGRDLAIDLLVISGNSITIDQIETGIGGPMLTGDDVKEQLDFGSLGFRVVYDLYQIEKRQWTGKRFGMSWRFEAGHKPYQGFYFAGSLGLTILKLLNRPY